MAEARDRFLSRELFPHTVTNATYNEQGKAPCDTGTRVEILDDIQTWVQDISDGSPSFLWLTGDPGAGKSAITASFARYCKDTGILWAQFFINRNNSDTTNPKAYFPSIARQFADRSPEAAATIQDALKNQPSLIDNISSEQAVSLFISTMEVACELNPDKPVVVAIDGLDETERSSLSITAVIFSKLFTILPRNAKLFISSRTEDEIRKPFTTAFSVKNVKHVHLDTSHPFSLRDVSFFLRQRVKSIVEDNDLNWGLWPGERRMEVLCDRASGLFIWAVTVTKFMQEQIKKSGTEIVNEILDQLTADDRGDINVLYATILRLTYTLDEEEWIYERFRRIIGCIVVLQEPLCIGDLSKLLHLRKTSTSGLVDMKHFVSQLRTVLVAGTDPIDGGTIPRLHNPFSSSSPVSVPMNDFVLI
jgi:hypothetical protein